MSFGTIVVDRDIPFLAGVFENWFDVRYLAGREITAADVRNAVALVVRTAPAATPRCSQDPPSVSSPRRPSGPTILTWTIALCTVSRWLPLQVVMPRRSLNMCLSLFGLWDSTVPTPRWVLSVWDM